jgi:hypothetical protein
MPSNIQEKGIIYFFTRGRVGIDDPQSVQDLQRSYFVLRPLPTGAKLGDGAIEDAKNNRLFALPKKVFPRGPNDKFMVFVERAKASMEELKKDFFQVSEKEVTATGNQPSHPITPSARVSTQSPPLVLAPNLISPTCSPSLNNLVRCKKIWASARKVASC